MIGPSTLAFFERKGAVTALAAACPNPVIVEIGLVTPESADSSVPLTSPFLNFSLVFA